MRAGVVVVFVGAFGTFPAVAAGESHFVGIPGKYFSPARLTVVAGDEVTWRNSDLLEHDVQAADGSFGSGVMGRFGGFTARFDGVGERPYLCSIHPFMRGQIDVAAAVMHGPAGSVLVGELVRLEGRAVAGVAVALERQLSGGAWRSVANAVAGPGGEFGFSVAAGEGDVYRAATAAGTSPPVALAVTARLEARIGVRRGSWVDVRTTPVQPGLVATLQRYSWERYMWRRIAHARRDRRGRAGFRMRSSRGRVRVILSRAQGGPPLATTAAIRVRDGKPIGDPSVPRHENPAGPIP